MTLEGARALVTGASRGIGRAVALELGKRGARVALAARDREALDTVAFEVKRAGGTALIAPADLRDESELLAVFEQIDEAWGGLDILINNAGVGRTAPYLTGTTEAWREMLDLNVLTLAVASREALARFPQSGGHIVNVGSLSGHRVPPRGGFYSATKYAVRALTEGLRMELHASGNRTRVAEVSPGFVHTDFHGSLAPEVRDEVHALREKIQFLRPEDVAASVLHILEAPEHVAIHDVLLRPREQGS